MKQSVYLLSLLISVSAKSSTLKYVQILFRHGDRTPTHTYPNDPHSPDTWEQGWGQLTQMGMQQEYELGEFLKKRYIDTGFIHADYKADDIYVISTYKDRAIMSAYCMLAGLYPPTGSQLWNPAIAWQPVPVHTIPKELDTILEVKCPTYDKLLEEYKHTDHAKQLIAQHMDLIKATGQYSGYPANAESLWDMIDPIYVENNHNMSFPAWLTRNDLYKKFIALKDLKAQLKFPTKALAKIRGGSLLGKIMKNFEDVAQFDNITQKIDFYSGHDTNINALLSLAGMFNGLHIHYAAALLMELHLSASEGWMVQFYFRNDSTVPPYLLNVPGCQSSCPLSQLTQLMHDNIPDDPYELCYGHKQTGQCSPTDATTPAIQTGPTAPSTGTQERNDLDCSGGRMRIHVPQTLLPTHIVTLRDPSCKVASNGSHLLADVGVNECGTTVSFTNDSVIFTNELVATALSGTTAPTIIDYGMNMKDQRVKISCIYPRENRVDFSYVPVMKEAHFYERQYGKLSFDVSQYSDEQFSHVIPHNGLPIGVTLNTELFIDISLRHASHKGVGIMVDSCIATPTSSPADPLWYTVIKDGCPAQQDVRTFASPDVDEFRFSFLVFRFTQAPLQKAGPNLPPTSMVFIHCQVSACPSQNCTNTCNPAGSHRVRREAELENSHLVSAGPFYLKSEEERGEYTGGVVAASVSVAVVATLVAIVALVAWRRSVNKLSKHQTLDEAS